MNPQEPQNITERTVGELTPDEAMADLAFATNLQDQIMPQMAMQEGAMMPPEGAGMPQEGMEQPLEAETPTEDIDTKLEAFKKEVKDTIKQEMSTMKEGLMDALNESD